MIPFKDYKGYTAVIDFNQDDQVFHGKILGLSDLVSFEGTNVLELDSAFREAVDDYLETCKEIGKNPEKTFKGSFNVRLSPKLHRSAYFFGESNNMSLNEVVSEAVLFFLSSHEHLMTNAALWEYSSCYEPKINIINCNSRLNNRALTMQFSPSRNPLVRALLKRDAVGYSHSLHWKVDHHR
ncbi:MAG: type II toxin-antitoxin system HicB family antitoxin [Bacteroidia bacterium]|nr:type II toxin-antitoxin system HicB family antitoxin [Bacteroidia bacterium]